jgi:hypothetical protein
LANEHALTLKEVPITIEYNDAPKRSVISHGITVLNGILNLAGQYRPLLFFSLLGTLMLLVGFAFGLNVVEILRTKQTLATGSALLSAIFSIVGVIFFSTGIILHSIRALLINFLGSGRLDNIIKG